MTGRLQARGAVSGLSVQQTSRCSECLQNVEKSARNGLAAGGSRIHESGDVLRFPLLHLDDRFDWSRWLEAAGALSEGLLHGPILNHASMVIDAAIDGQGIALARTMLAANDLIARRLVRPFRTALPLKNTYWMVCPKATRALPKIVAFRDWLLTEVAADRQRLAAVNQRERSG